jgi:hypothetical protein
MSRRLSQLRSMVVRLFSPPRWRLISSLRSVVWYLAISARCCADGRAPGSSRGACATNGVCAADGWHRPSRCGVLMAAMMSWSTL